MPWTKCCTPVGHLQPSILTSSEVAFIPALVSDFKIPTVNHGTTPSSCDVNILKLSHLTETRSVPEATLPTENRTTVAVSDLLGIHRRTRCWATIQRQLPNPDRLLDVTWRHTRLQDIISATTPRQRIHLCLFCDSRSLFTEDMEQMAELHAHLQNHWSENKPSHYFWFGIWYCGLQHGSGGNRALPSAVHTVHQPPASQHHQDHTQKYLGVQLDDKLDWTANTEAPYRKVLPQTTGILQHLQKALPVGGSKCPHVHSCVLGGAASRKGT